MMKKALISAVLIAAIVCSFGGFAHADDITDLPEQSVAAEQSAPVQGFIPGSVPAVSSPMDAMIPPINALVLSMLEQDLSYDESSDVFMWNSVYYMISLCGQMDSRAELTDTQLILPTETVEDYASALFTNYSGLPALPEQMRDRVSYDPLSDSYSLARGDAGLSETLLNTVEYLDDGTVAITGSLISLVDGHEMCSFTAALAEKQTMFGYAISELNIMK